jgi:hypothetical protein
MTRQIRLKLKEMVLHLQSLFLLLKLYALDILSRLMLLLGTIFCLLDRLDAARVGFLAICYSNRFQL